MIIPHFTQFTSPHLSVINTGLGNALFQIFTAYSISRKTNQELNLIKLLPLLCKLQKWNLFHKDTIYRNTAIIRQKICKNVLYGSKLPT